MGSGILAARRRASLIYRKPIRKIRLAERRLEDGEES